MSISFRIDWFDLHCVSYPVDSCPINIRYECIYLLTGVFLFLCHCSRCVSYESLMFGFSVGYLLSYLLWRWTLWVLTSFVLVYAIHLAFLGLLAFFLAACVHAESLPPCQTLCDPMDCSPPGSSVHRDSPGKNTGVGCPALLQGIFLSQGSNSHLLSLLPWQVVVFFFSLNHQRHLESLIFLPAFGQMFCVFVLFTQVIWKAVNSIFTGLMVILVFQKAIAPMSLHQCQKCHRPWRPSPGRVTDLTPLPVLPAHVHLPLPKIFLVQANDTV